ncbi:LPS-assembly protein LptD [Thiomicrospira microaerophila]|uniref:LPS-assembly protein LptD n=1 Tax=Thiomicrospira microaerophila TaxID=406020 RepID=UPI00069808FE|nr:LPS assembly protein LptD [Thiomicrospira microaerophila]
MFNRFTPFYVCLLSFATLGASQAQTTELPAKPLTCGIDWLFPLIAMPQLNSATHIEADHLTQSNSFQLKLIGRATLSQPGLVVMADQLNYDREQQSIALAGQIELHRSDLLLGSETAFYNQTTQQAELTQLRYQLKPSGYHGQAEWLKLDGLTQISQLHQASYTTCALEDPVWQLNFNHLEINQTTRRIYGHHGYLSVQGVPLLYTPYINFPLENRATGLLFPTFGTHKTPAQPHSEWLVALPFYWAIADNYDATFTTLWMQQRGMLLDTEWRYLQPSHSGELDLSLIQDQLAQSEGLQYLSQGQIQQQDAQSLRWRARFDGRQRWSERLNSQIHWHEVSDPDFYNDMPLDFNSETTQTHAENSYRMRQVLLRYQQPGLQAHIQHYGYLPLRHGEGMLLEKSPELGINWSKHTGHWHARVYAEATEFKRYSGFNDFSEEGYLRARALDNSLRLNPNQHQGQRYLLQPNLSYRLEQPYGFMHAQVQGNYRRYQLTNAPDAASTDSLIMQYALHSGLFFDRTLTLANQQYTQTLEPQMQWLYVPYHDQSHLSLFDTGMNSLDFSNLFQLNRFSGFDRIGDTQQVSLALTSRLLNAMGQTRAEAGIGQVFYLKERQVGLIGHQPQDNQRSDYFIKLGAHLDSIDFVSTSQLNVDNFELSQTLNRLKWQAFERIELLAVHQGFNLNQPNARQQTLATGLMLKLNNEWQAGSYINYDLEQSVRREFIGGLRYDSCCWASELMIKQNQMADGQYNYSIKYLIELKGLSSVGQRLTDQIQRSLDF